MKPTNSTWRATLALIFGACVLCLVVAAAAPASPISSKKARLKAVQAKLETVYAQVEVVVEKYNQATSRLDGVALQIKQNQRLLDLAERNLRRANTQLKVRAENLYKSRDIGIVDVLFQADSFDDLVTQLDMMTRIGNSDVDTVKAIAAYRRDIKDRRIKLNADKKAAATLVAERAAQKDQILALESKLEQMTTGLKAEIKRLQRQAAAAARLAAQQALGGPLPPPLDPNSPGHPEIVTIAQRYFGVPYVWGGASPGGFDCSGLTMYCYAQIGIPLYHGATVQQQQSIPVALSDMRPGDLVFFGNASFSHHVAIYAGGASVIEAPHTGDVVRYGALNGRGAWIGGRF
ncbi:MAG: NlpC/P60 family protein [Actinobacteria bacterium]|nr:NlpC/P60 family protein [Actinomycetota bacterium]